ncbi:unnamed protein product, partial [Ilex paraguariensis]
DHLAPQFLRSHQSGQCVGIFLLKHKLVSRVSNHPCNRCRSPHNLKRLGDVLENTKQ